MNAPLPLRTALRGLCHARLPRWLLPADWPMENGTPVLAHLRLDEQGRLQAVTPQQAMQPADGEWDLAGRLVLPGLVDAHTHLDKAFTLSRMGTVRPGLLGAIEAMMADRRQWTPADIRSRASRALEMAWAAGVVHLRTHCDWWEPHTTPLAWPVLRELAAEWAGRITLERASLVPLHLYAERDTAMSIAATVRASGPGALLGGFVHTSNWNASALRNLFDAAQAHALDVDLHVDEELDPRAQGLATIASIVNDIAFDGHVVCGHVCALSAQDESLALRTLDAVAALPQITLASLPITNLLLQDAQVDRTPRLRGITLLKEARARGIALMIASDNVEDPFCPVGSFDPLEAFGVGVSVGQLPQAFDQWSESVCRSDWLARSHGAATDLLQAGRAANFVVFEAANAWSFPSRAQPRTVIRQGCIA
ncbi:MAG: amidohydrolase [Betaproteobacteria bacterium]|nr:amidohydrolase [Betaproteobacteria bacterium]